MVGTFTLFSCLFVYNPIKYIIYHNWVELSAANFFNLCITIFWIFYANVVYFICVDI